MITFNIFNTLCVVRYHPEDVSFPIKPFKACIFYHIESYTVKCFYFIVIMYFYFIVIISFNI